MADKYDAIRDYLNHRAAVVSISLRNRKMLEESEIDFLLYLGSSGGTSGQFARTHELITSFGYSPSSVSHITDALSDKGLVEKLAGDKNKRVKLLKLTPRGKEVYESLVENINNHVQSSPAGLSI